MFVELRGQNEAAHKIQVLARSYGDSIVLRWAPSTPLAWQLLNKYGYRIERFTIVRDSVVLASKEATILAGGPVLPARQEAWERRIDTDDFVAIAAQAIFGDDFQLSQSEDVSFGEVATKARELESRYSYTLFVADLSPLAANLSALRWSDRKISNRERYLYRVYSLVPDDIMNVEFGYVYQDARNSPQLPKPQPPVATAGDRVVRLEWDPVSLTDFYTGYYLERSVNGNTNYRPVNKFPLVGIEAGQEAQKIVVTDSIENSVEVSYRIRGTNPFGDKGPYSSEVTLRGNKKLKTGVIVKKVYLALDNTVVIQWQIDEEESLIDRFDIERAPKEGGPYRVINSGKPGSREAVDQKPLSTNYYRIATVGKTGERLFSYPYFIQLVDSISPARPSEVVGRSSAQEIVTLEWKPNIEPDIQGYYVYRSEFKGAEYARISNQIVLDAKFLDSLDIRSTGRKVYYKIQAVDLRFNASDFSEAVEVVRPDRIPPVPPVMETLRLKEDTVLICWKNSFGSDVVAHTVYKQKEEGQWEVLKRVPQMGGNCVQDIPRESGSYRYRIEAEDSAGLTSQSLAGKLAVRLKRHSTAQPVVRGVVDREAKQIRLSWILKSADVTKYLIYRSADGLPLSLYGSATGDKFTDGRVVPNTTYTYAVKAVFKDGQESLFSDLLKVVF